MCFDWLVAIKSRKYAAWTLLGHLFLITTITLTVQSIQSIWLLKVITSFLRLSVICLVLKEQTTRESKKDERSLFGASGIKRIRLRFIILFQLSIFR